MGVSWIIRTLAKMVPTNQESSKDGVSLGEREEIFARTIHLVTQAG